MSRLALLLAALCALLAAAPAVALADAFVVASAGDASDGTAGDGDCDPDDDGSESDCTLRAAIEEANATADADSVSFADGVTAIAVPSRLVVGDGCASGCALAIDGGGDVVLQWSGTPGAALTFAAPQAGSSLTAARIERAGGDGALVRVEGPGVTVSSVELAGAATSGLELAGSAADASLAALTVSGSGGDGIALGGSAQRVAIAGTTVSGSGGDGIAIGDSAQRVTIAGSTVSGSGGDGIAIAGTASDVTIADSTVTASAGDGVEAGAGVQGVTLARTTVSGNGGDGITIRGQGVIVARSPVFGNAIGPIALAPGANGGVAPPGGLRVGPRRADGTLPVTGTAPAGLVEVYRGDPRAAQPIVALGDVTSDGSFAFVASAEPAPGTTVAATFRGPSGTSAFATAVVPDDVASPEVVGAVATSRSEVRVLLSEPLDPATVEPADFALEMAGVQRTVDGVRVAGADVFLTSSGWTHGEAGFLAVAGPGALADTAGNASLGTPVVRVAAAPGDLEPPVASRLSIRPSRICLTPGRRCRRTGARVVFLASEAGRGELVIMRGNRVVGVDRTPALDAGRNVVRFTGRLNGRKLRAGSYRMLLYLEDAVGNRTVEPPIRRFRIVRSTRRR